MEGSDGRPWEKSPNKEYSVNGIKNLNSNTKEEKTQSKGFVKFSTIERFFIWSSYF